MFKAECKAFVDKSEHTHQSLDNQLQDLLTFFHKLLSIIIKELTKQIFIIYIVIDLFSSFYF